VLQTIMPGELSNNTYWINKAHLPHGLSVNVSNQYLNNAHIYFYVLDKTVGRDPFFYKGIPMISLKVDLTIGIEEIINGDNKIVPLNTDVIDQEVKCAIGREIRRQLGNAFLYSKQNKLDILDINETFYFSKYKEYTEYLQKGKTPEDFVQDTQISVEVRVEVI